MLAGRSVLWQFSAAHETQCLFCHTLLGPDSVLYVRRSKMRECSLNLPDFWRSAVKLLFLLGGLLLRWDRAEGSTWG